LRATRGARARGMVPRRRTDGVRDERRERAIARVKAKRDFTRVAITFALVGLVLVMVWFFTTRDSEDALFWPILPILGMGRVDRSVAKRLPQEAHHGGRGSPGDRRRRVAGSIVDTRVGRS
jgi:hypothetical protein